MLVVDWVRIPLSPTSTLLRRANKINSCSRILEMIVKLKVPICIVSLDVSQILHMSLLYFEHLIEAAAAGQSLQDRACFPTLDFDTNALTHELHRSFLVGVDLETGADLLREQKSLLVPHA